MKFILIFSLLIQSVFASAGWAPPIFRISSATTDGKVIVANGTTGSLVKESTLTGIASVSAGLLSAFTLSSGLSSVISDETGTGVLVFSISPALTGVPTAPTAVTGTNTTQLATTAFVQAQIALISGGGITSFNGLTAAIQLLAIGTSGTAPAFNSATATHTLNIPMASTAAVTAGLLSKTDYDIFNAKQAAGNYVTALTGDGTASGPGSVALTLATVNSNVGSFGTASNVGTFTVNGKGLITAASNTAIAIAESQVTSLVADLALKAPLASPALTGTPTAPTASALDNSTKIATTAYVDAAITAGSSSSSAPTIQTKAANFTAVCGLEYWITTGVNVQLPTPVAGCRIILKSFGSNTINILRAASEKINNIAATFTFTQTDESRTVDSNATDWATI